MALRYSTIVSIIYFSVNVIFMFGLGLFVYKNGNHKLKSKSYAKDLWNQRKIFAPLIVHFYDTATDIGVIYNWNELMMKEKSPDTNYESVDMEIFFWCGIAFLILYRLGLLLFALYEWCVSGDGESYYVLLVFVDLYIFVAVYESFSGAQGIITSNAAKRAKNREIKMKKKAEEVNKQLETAIEMGNIAAAKNIATQIQQEQEIEPADKQMYIQLAESVFESMPQIILQSVFIIRSANDISLKNDGSNISLMLFSVFASLFSISNKFVWADKESIQNTGKSLKPKLSFPGCVQYYYVVRVLWRLNHVMAKFAVFTLIWVVLGGAWLPIFTGVAWIFWTLMILGDDAGWIEALFFAVPSLVAVIPIRKTDIRFFTMKHVESTIGLTIITIFGMMNFDCGICTDPKARKLFGNNDNDRVLIYWIVAIVAHILDLLFYTILYCKDIVEKDV
eukprot:486575_1